jgi:hypothetical protein
MGTLPILTNGFFFPGYPSLASPEEKDKKVARRIRTTSNVSSTDASLSTSMMMALENFSPARPRHTFALSVGVRGV